MLCLWLDGAIVFTDVLPINSIILYHLQVKLQPWPISIHQHSSRYIVDMGMPNWAYGSCHPGVYCKEARDDGS
jgi:hypothetical protein